MTNHQQIQHYNERLFINNKILDVDNIIRTLSKDENVCLKKLSLINIRTGVVPAISNLLANLKGSLETLSIQSDLMCSEDIQTISDCIINNNITLAKLTLSIGDAGWITIITAVQSSLLQKLSFKKQYIDINAALAISDTIRKAHLTDLSFIQCTFQKGAIALIMTAIITSAVVTLVLENIQFNDDEYLAVSDCIARSKLTKLSLCGSQTPLLPVDNACTIEDAIKASSLTTLDVRNSSFFNNAETIIDIIKFACLTKFKFNNDCFSPEEEIAIIDAIKKRCDYRIIPMYGTKFTDEILTKICDLLKDAESSTLTCLDLSNCNLSEAQSILIINSMKESSIASLKFESNYVNAKSEVMRAMCDLLENCTIKKMAFTGLTNATINILLPSIKKSSLTKFKMRHWSNVSTNTRDEIKEILRIQRNILNRTYKTKSART